MHQGITVHGLLASFLAFGGRDTSRYSHWKKVWPSMQDLQGSMPILWPSFMREPLDRRGDPCYMNGPREDLIFIFPPAIAGRWAQYQMHEFWNVRDTAPVYQQEKKLKADWNIVSRVFPDKTLPVYTYYWLIVNTRSFYFEIPNTRGRGRVTPGRGLLSFDCRNIKCQEQKLPRIMTIAWFYALSLTISTIMTME